MQGVVALSVGEAEYYALVKGACEGLGIQGSAEGHGDSSGYKDTDGCKRSERDSIQAGIGEGKEY